MQQQRSRRNVPKTDLHHAQKRLIGCCSAYAALVTAFAASVIAATISVANDPPPSHSVATRRLSKDIGVGPSLTGTPAYQSLVNQGYRSVLSVDGRPSDINAAKAAGLAIGHTPIGYDAIDSFEAAELANAWLQLPKPVYVHCHHGRIRGPAVATMFFHWSGAATREARQALRRCSFPENYTSLEASIFQSQPSPTPHRIPEASDVSPLVAAMLNLESSLTALSNQTIDDEKQLLWDQAIQEVDRSVSNDPTWDNAAWQKAVTIFRDPKSTPHDIRTRCVHCHGKKRSQ